MVEAGLDASYGENQGKVALGPNQTTNSRALLRPRGPDYLSARTVRPLS